ncbi:formylmethanofuran dehydrogenase subunit B [Benzoatithermus flavus]|uniref:Formylmethanofuran dehydrogenase, subunit B n=1 Tax=Benzoatithermus flavus TaxID=3108223 RepID=A0ABU8XQ18_9PROT
MATPQAMENVVCPFCSLACDDLVVEPEGKRLRLLRPACPLAEREFARDVPEAVGPLIEGAPASLEEAVARAAAILARARLPLFAGLGTDVAGMRAVLTLAERTGGIVDHAGSRGLMANIRTMQDGGWVTTTLAEVRNRADLVLFVGTDTADVTPRFVERCLAPSETLFGPIRRELVYLGDGLEPARDLDARITALPCAADDLAQALLALRALLAGRRLGVQTIGALPVAALAELAQKLTAARYPVIVWAAGELPGESPDLLVGTLAALIKDLNVKGRCAGLPLAGPDDIIGVNQVCTWQTGVPLRSGFMAGVPDHDPLRWDAGTLVASGAVDALLWLSSLRDQPVPDTGMPTIVLLRPGNTLPRPVEVVIPVGTPGLDHSGSVYRTDSVVSLPVRALRDTGLPGAAEVLRRIGAGLAPSRAA